MDARMKRSSICLLIGISAFAQAKRAVLIITDGEGVAGICRQEQVEPTNPELRQLLTGETNAAVDGFLAGGADEVIVWDGHDSSRTLSVATIHPKAKLIIGSPGSSMLLDRGGFAGVAFVGQHARAGRMNAIMAHSESSLGIQRIRMNGKEVGEIELTAAIAGHFNVPVIFLSGDKAAAEDVKAIVPDVETAVVKEGFGYYACLSLSAEAARDLIRQGAASAMRRAAQIRPYKLDGPVTLEIESSTRSTPPGEISRHAERVDARTVRYRGKDILDVWALWLRH
jgi:D-amino peptidase